MVVAIDGPSGVGKSTVARAVADALGLPHLDTGAYYRMATFLVLRAEGDPADAGDVLSALGQSDIDFANDSARANGEEVSEALRSPEVTAAVSTVAAIEDVRAAVVALQRQWVADRQGRAVVEGRDIGTVVFPDATVKVYLTADLPTRAQRRARDPEVAETPLPEIEAMIAARDLVDSSRNISPLRPADDAEIIDTSNLTVAEVVHRVLDLAGTA